MTCGRKFILLMDGLLVIMRSYTAVLQRLSISHAGLQWPQALRGRTTKMLDGYDLVGKRLLEHIPRLY